MSGPAVIERLQCASCSERWDFEPAVYAYAAVPAIATEHYLRSRRCGSKYYGFPPSALASVRVRISFDPAAEVKK